MTDQKKFLSLKNQLVVFLGLIVVFLGLLFHFYSDTYPMLKSLNYLFILAYCIGGCMAGISIFIAFYSQRNDLKEARKQLVIETSLTFAINLSLQALVFHTVFHDKLTPVSIGVFFIFVSYVLVFIPTLYSLTTKLYKKYYVLLFTIIGFISLEALISGIFLTFTGSIDPIVTSGIELLALGIFSIVVIITVFIFYPKWKFVLSDDELEEEDEKEKEEDEDKEEE